MEPLHLTGILRIRPGRKMPTSLYIVYESLSRWWLDADGEIRGPFASREDAMHSASALASGRPNGRQVDVYSPDEAGRNVKVWSTREE